jgi:hypothetical protein
MFRKFHNTNLLATSPFFLKNVDGPLQNLGRSLTKRGTNVNFSSDSPHCLLGSSSIRLEIRGGNEEESRKQRGIKEEEEGVESAESAKSAKSAKSVQKCGNRKLCEKSAESAVLLGDAQVST